MAKKETKQNKLKNYGGYAGMATEMFVLLFLMVFLGKKLDNYLGNEKKIATAIFVIVGLFAYLYRLYLQVTKKEDK